MFIFKKNSNVELEILLKPRTLIPGNSFPSQTPVFQHLIPFDMSICPFSADRTLLSFSSPPSQPASRATTRRVHRRESLFLSFSLSPFSLSSSAEHARPDLSLSCRKWPPRRARPSLRPTTRAVRAPTPPAPLACTTVPRLSAHAHATPRRPAPLATAAVDDAQHHLHRVAACPTLHIPPRRPRPRPVRVRRRRPWHSAACGGRHLPEASRRLTARAPTAVDAQR